MNKFSMCRKTKSGIRVDIKSWKNTLIIKFKKVYRKNFVKL